MKVTINPAEIKGTVHAPASKSSMQRACAAALLAKGTSTIKNPGTSNDDKAALDIIQKLGAQVQNNPDGTITIISNGVQPVHNEINCGESGLSIRMFTPIVSLSDQQITVKGEGSLVTRPLHFFDEILPKIGVSVNSNNGHLPLQIKGPVKPSDITVDGSLSSQFLTGLLMATGAADINETVTITVNDLKSKPYIDLTLKVMESFGRKVSHDNYEKFYLEPQEQKYTATTYTVEGDWSGASFLLVAGAIAGNITVVGLDVFSTQADKAILQALMDCGCVLSIQEDKIEVGPAKLKAFQFDATDCPDLFPPLVALASFCEGTTVIQGVSRLAHKESNRALTLQDEFGKLGIEIELQDDIMIINGAGKVKSASVHSRHDHRIAMACAVAALKAEGAVTIEEANAINKSYPAFYNHLQSIGATVVVD